MIAIYIIFIIATSQYIRGDGTLATFPTVSPGTVLQEYTIGFGDSSDELTGSNKFIYYDPSGNLDGITKTVNGANVIFSSGDHPGSYSTFNVSGDSYPDIKYVISLNNYLPYTNGVYDNTSSGLASNTLFHITVELVAYTGAYKYITTRMYFVTWNCTNYSVVGQSTLSDVTTGSPSIALTMTTPGTGVLDYNITTPDSTETYPFKFSATFRVTASNDTSA